MLLWTAAAALPRAETGGAPSILLLSIDTLRADHLGSYGYPRPTDPGLQRRTRNFTRFTAASTPIPLTVPAHAALLTGLHPRDLGILNNRQILNPGEPEILLVNSLHAAGYLAAAVVGSRVLDGTFTGLSSGFDVYLDPGAAGGPNRRTAREVNALVAPLLESTRQPLFLVAHYYDVHEPYVVPDNLACLLRADDLLDAVLRRRGLQGIPYEQVLNRQRSEPVSGHGRQVTLRQMVARYDAAVRLATDSAADLLAMWEGSHHGRNSLVIITSDHGEGLGQHGFWSHGMNLYDESLRVPLLVRWPGDRAPGSVHHGPVSLLDLAPTMLAAADVSHPGSLPGRDLRRLLAAPEADPVPFVAQRMRYLPAQRPPGLRNWRPGDGFAVLSGDLKYIQDEGESPELYDRSDDPLELRNLLLAGPRRGDGLEDTLRRWSQQHPDGINWPPTPVDPRRLQILRSLGYADP